MKFGERLLRSRHEPWAPFYIDYDALKETLEQIAAQSQDGSAPADDDEGEGAGVPAPFSPRRYRRLLQLHRFARDEPPGSTLFLIQLDRQVEKVVLFFLQEQGRIAYQLAEHRQEQALLAAAPLPAPDLLHGLRLKYHAAGAQLLRLLQFVELNATGVRKILKKHDKLTRWAASGLYFGGHRRSGYLLRPLLQDDALAAVCVTLEAALAELDRLEEDAREVALAAVLSPAASPTRSRETEASAVTTSALLPRPVHVRSRTEPGAPGSGRGHRRVRSHAEDYRTAAPPTDAVLAQIHAARRRLQQTSEYADLLATTALLGRVPEEDDEDEEEGAEETDSVVDASVHPLHAEPGRATRERRRPTWISNQLNLMSTLLYMTNYYIVAPTSGSYAERLGSSEGLAAMIIGMTPIAALVSTLLYSWWTSHSYKAALIFASCASLLGNLFYGLGLPIDSLTMVLVGRLLNGFGSARSINRRYIADSYSRADRTVASAAFVTAGALGMALGPAIAAGLHLATRDAESLWWQVENAPGWFMSAAWGVYLVLLVFYFEDPQRRPEHTAPSQVELGKTGSAGETQPLLANGSLQKLYPPPMEPPLWRNVPVMITFLIYFVLKLILECVLSASSIITHFYFGWSAGGSGLFLSSLGALMLPANWCVARLAQSYEDRELMMAFQVLMLLGCAVCLDMDGGRYSLSQYAIGSVVLFVSSNALEGPSMSLLSKTIPASWSRGFFNIGLLATEAGTLGRAVGDVFLTVSGAGGVQHMLNYTFAALSSVSLLSLLAFYQYFDQLQPMDKDD